MITKAQLIEKIEDFELDDSELANYLQIDTERSDAFEVSYKIKPNTVLNLSEADKGILGSLNKRTRRKRQHKYERKIKNGFKGIRIVSEGDSWFQYPIFLNDVIDNLDKNNAFAIYCLSYGGDWLSNIYREQEYLKAIREKQPKVFLISAGGNDLAGQNRFGTLVHSYKHHLEPKDYINEEGERFFEDMYTLYNHLFRNITKEDSALKVICHGYDYPIPNNQKWLGIPLSNRGITDVHLQSEIMKVFMDRFNDILISLSQLYPNVHYVDLRSTIDVSTGWFDELHPNNHYFAVISKKIEDKILEVLDLS